jgi:hypothetical protein
LPLLLPSSLPFMENAPVAPRYAFTHYIYASRFLLIPCLYLQCSEPRASSSCFWCKRAMDFVLGGGGEPQGEWGSRTNHSFAGCRVFCW